MPVRTIHCDEYAAPPRAVRRGPTVGAALNEGTREVLQDNARAEREVVVAPKLVELFLPGHALCFFTAAIISSALPEPLLTACCLYSTYAPTKGLRLRRWRSLVERGHAGEASLSSSRAVRRLSSRNWSAAR